MILNKEDIVQNQLLYFQTRSVTLEQYRICENNCFVPIINEKLSLFLKMTPTTTCPGQQGLYRGLQSFELCSLSEHFTFLSHCSFSTERIASSKQISKTKKLLSSPRLWKKTNKTHQNPLKTNNQIPQTKHHHQ